MEQKCSNVYAYFPISLNELIKTLNFKPFTSPLFVNQLLSHP